jgi:tRNA/tmRNA/rRNA uracil-C5-methylase (TrmA/RlmC/RlmD family)
MSRRPARPRQPRGASVVGRRFEAVVGPVAHGGHCVVRLPEPESRVVFVRHAIPGERVLLAITEGDKFWRADAVEVLEPAATRVTQPCPYAGPGLCGGCDFQHVELAHQRALKADVVEEQLRRLARIEREVVVEAVPGDDGGLRWRTRAQFVPLADGGRGMRRHRSRQVIEVDDCPITRHDARNVDDTSAGDPPLVEVVETSHGTHSFAVAADGFWQVHPGAPRVLVETVLELLRPPPGERTLDL